MKETFDGGKLMINDSKLNISVAGISGSNVRKYQVSGKDGECSILTIEGSSGNHKYCVSGATLEVRDPSTPLIVVYRRQ